MDEIKKGVLIHRIEEGTLNDRQCNVGFFFVIIYSSIYHNSDASEFFVLFYFLIKCLFSSFIFFFFFREKSFKYTNELEGKKNHN